MVVILFQMLLSLALGKKKVLIFLSLLTLIQVAIKLFTVNHFVQHSFSSLFLGFHTSKYHHAPQHFLLLCFASSKILKR